MTLCDKEGGAHLDPEFTDEYYEVNYNFGYKIVKENGEESELKNNVFAETTISIAYELLDAISIYFYSVQNKPFEIKDTKFNIITISYSSTAGDKCVRFFLNTRGNLYSASRLAFDYYHVASYTINKLRGYKYSKEDGTFFIFLTVDEFSAKTMIVLRDDDTETYEVLQEVSAGLFSMINHTSDSLVGPGRRLEEIIKGLAEARGACFDKFLSLQRY